MNIEISGGFALLVIGGLLILILIPGIRETIAGLLNRPVDTTKWTRVTFSFVLLFGIAFLLAGSALIVRQILPEVPAPPSPPSTATPTLALEMTPSEYPSTARSTLAPPISPTGTQTPNMTYTPTDTPTVTPTSTNTPTPAPICQWTEDFADDVLDRTKWVPASDQGLIYVGDGTLNFALDQPQSESAWANLVALPQGQPVKEISYTFMLMSYAANIPGGIGVDLILSDRRLLSLDMGPGPSGPWTEISICPSEDSDYDECDHYDGPGVTNGVPMSVRIVLANGNLEFYVDGVMYHLEPVGASIARLQFFLYSDPGGAFHATIDDVHISTC